LELELLKSRKGKTHIYQCKSQKGSLFLVFVSLIFETRTLVSTVGPGKTRSQPQ